MSMGAPFERLGQASSFLHRGNLCWYSRSITADGLNINVNGVFPMDDYQEEWLELRAAEHDPLEPADDATEL
jgi:hypothetical protein